MSFRVPKVFSDSSLHITLAIATCHPYDWDVPSGQAANGKKSNPEFCLNMQIAKCVPLPLRSSYSSLYLLKKDKLFVEILKLSKPLTWLLNKSWFTITFEDCDHHIKKKNCVTTS